MIISIASQIDLLEHQRVPLKEGAGVTHVFNIRGFINVRE